MISIRNNRRQRRYQNRWTRNVVGLVSVFDDDRWTYTVGLLAAVAIGVVVGALASSSSRIVIGASR